MKLVSPLRRIRMPMFLAVAASATAALVAVTWVCDDPQSAAATATAPRRPTRLDGRQAGENRFAQTDTPPTGDSPLPASAPSILDHLAALQKRVPPSRSCEDLREEYLGVLSGDGPVLDKKIAVFHLANLRLLDDRVVREILRNMRATDDEDFLGTAIWAVLRVKTHEVQVGLMELGSERKPESVRSAAYLALQFRPGPDVTSYLLARYDAEAAPAVKRAALLGLAHHALKSLPARHRLERIAAWDANPALNRIAREELELIEEMDSEPALR